MWATSGSLCRPSVAVWVYPCGHNWRPCHDQTAEDRRAFIHALLDHAKSHAGLFAAQAGGAGGGLAEAEGAGAEVIEAFDCCWRRRDDETSPRYAIAAPQL